MCVALLGVTSPNAICVCFIFVPPGEGVTPPKGGGNFTPQCDYYLLGGHMSSSATASHIAKTEVVRDTDSFADIVRGLHVFGRKVLRSGALYSGVLRHA